MSEEKQYKHKIKFGFSKARKRKGVKRLPKPIKRSKYAQQLFEIGAGWNE